MKYLLIFLFPLVINAQSNPSEKEVADKVSQLIKAMIDADENMLKSLTSDKLVYGHSLGAVEDKTAFVQNIVNGNSDFVTIDITDQTLTISGNAAIVRHKLYAKTNDKGKPGEVRLVIMQVWQRTKKDGEWKLLARQAVRPPQQ
ncbi:MAG: nuclear transport factor 2 family protein [Sphingobacteriales bacterium]|jgi:ketosteroid isomerase-like protein